ncbi:MAG TPA: DUF5709 domain-containing protein [Amycolatopsis sp.]|jgi:hypothetical protein|nr:DUF5709 domain-containing protein [Amycolatopsis sp.]
MDDDIDDNADTGLLDPEDSLEDGDPYDEGYSPPERPLESEDFGMTPEEEREGESLAARLARELPDVEPDDGDDLGDTEDTDGELRDNELGDLRAGRLVATDEGFGEDTDAELHATDVGVDGGAASAEEAAVHLVDYPDA